MDIYSLKSVVVIILFANGFSSCRRPSFAFTCHTNANILSCARSRSSVITRTAAHIHTQTVA